MSGFAFWLRSIAIVAFDLALLIAAAGMSYQAAGTHFDAQRSPEPGQLVDAGGMRLMIHCTGTGSPTVILESGLGDGAGEWRRVQPEIARHARVCSYDRAGYGGSDPGQMPRTSARIAEELHALLQNAGERPPYVLVGHSFGGYNVRVYNGRYPDEVAGMVLVDATQEDQYRLLPRAWLRIGEEQLQRYQRQARWAPVFIDMGVARLMLRSRGQLTENSYRILQAKYVKARASELENIQVSAGEARQAGDLGYKPLIVLSAGKNSDEALRGGLSEGDFREFQRVWVDVLQVRLAGLSRRGERIVVGDSGHDIPGERPEAIVSAVERMRTAVVAQ